MQLSLFSFSSPSFFPKQSHPKHYICPCATYSLATFTWLTQSPLRSCGVASIITLKKEIKRKKNQGSTVHKQSKKGWHRHWKTYVQFLFLIFLRGRIRIHFSSEVGSECAFSWRTNLNSHFLRSDLNSHLGRISRLTRLEPNFSYGSDMDSHFIHRSDPHKHFS